MSCKRRSILLEALLDRASSCKRMSFLLRLLLGRVVSTLASPFPWKYSVLLDHVDAYGNQPATGKYAPMGVVCHFGTANPHMDEDLIVYR